MVESPDSRSAYVMLLATILDAVSGEWCEACKAPSVVRGNAALELAGRPWQVVSVSECSECGSRAWG